jgi:hypothetical protein
MQENCKAPTQSGQVRVFGQPGSLAIASRKSRKTGQTPDYAALLLLGATLRTARPPAISPSKIQERRNVGGVFFVETCHRSLPEARCGVELFC